MTLVQTTISSLFRRVAPAAFSSLLLAAITSPLAHAEAPVQIHISKEQIQRAGIQTEAAVAATTANNAINTAGKVTTDAGQQISGTVVAPTNAIIVVSSIVSGVIQQIHVNSLQPVQPSSPVATMFSQQLMEMQREYLQLASQARLSKEKRERDEALLKEGIIALSRVQESRAAAVQAEVAANERYQTLRAAGLSSAQLRSILVTHALSPYLTVSAGVRGTLLELNLTTGQRIEAGMPIAKISKDTALWIELQASRQQAEQIRLGDLLQIKGCNRSTAKVIAISPQINGSNQSTLIRAEQSKQNNHDGCLKLNQFVEASHSSGKLTADSVGVPASAIVRNGVNSYVFIQNNKGFEAVKVQLMPGSADKAWVSGKLKAGDPVAVKGIIAIKGAWIGLGADEPETATQPISAKPAKDSVQGGTK